ncbi:MAG: SurA N-terminal domain-containing protein [Endomicrobia bacterium]|nr:SurA N-terminal domain-containing protein [Endomicrobiia bacterium]MCL2799461.1 SurA N-terminal domain-containing protein [Endomicrobiia bacterium]
MMNFLRKHMRKIFIITILGFLAGIFMGFGSYFFQKDNYKTAVTVNGVEIPLKLFNSLYSSAVEMMRKESAEEITDETLLQIKVKTLQALVQDEIFYQQSKNYGIIVSDFELKNDIQDSLMFKNENMFDPRLYYRFLQTIKMTPKEYESMRKKQIAGDKLKILLASSIKLMNAEYEAAAKANADITRDQIHQMKINQFLNEWYINLAKKSNVISNNSIFAK